MCGFRSRKSITNYRKLPCVDLRFLCFRPEISAKRLDHKKASGGFGWHHSMLSLEKLGIILCTGLENVQDSKMSVITERRGVGVSQVSLFGLLELQVGPKKLSGCAGRACQAKRLSFRRFEEVA